MTDYSELKKLAEAATQGDWNHFKHGVIKGGPVVQFVNGSSQQQIAMTTGADWMRPDEQTANADFIASANPAVVLALIAENEALRKVAACGKMKVVYGFGDYGLCGEPSHYPSDKGKIMICNDCQALRKDAERYRKIRSGPILDHEDRGVYILDERGEQYQELALQINGEELDSAVDEAIAKEANHEQGL